MSRKCQSLTSWKAEVYHGETICVWFWSGWVLFDWHATFANPFSTASNNAFPSQLASLSPLWLYRSRFSIRPVFPDTKSIIPVRTHQTELFIPRESRAPQNTAFASATKRDQSSRRQIISILACGRQSVFEIWKRSLSCDLKTQGLVCSNKTPPFASW